MNTSEYRRYHESFMQNNHGSTALHTFFCIFFTVQCSIYSAIGEVHSAIGDENELKQYFYEYIAIVVPLIAAHTFLSDYIYLLNLIIFSLLMHKFQLHRYKLDITNRFKLPNGFLETHNRSVSILRGLTYLITVCCILAVDFQSFPRYLAKTEKFGFSLMDTGVGLFVLMSGLVHKDLRKHKLIVIIKSNLKLIAILLFLGIARYKSVKQFDYHEHVTEYGVHWNFFFTLAVCKLLSTILLLYMNRALILCVITMFLHEFLLYYYLQNWVFSNAPRTTLLSANREGISSSLGYVALYLFAVHVKEVLSDKFVPKYKVIIKLICGSIFLWMLLRFINIYRPASRTLANAGYCIYLDAVLITILSIMYVFETLFKDKHKDLHYNVPSIISVVNDNGLIYFLVANVLTGAINLSIRTLLVPTTTTFVILNGYMVVTIALIVYFKNNGVMI